MTGTMLLAVLMLFAPVLPGSGTYRWVRALPMGSGAWQDHWIPDRFPMALMPSPGPAGRLWMVGGLGVWSSANGRGWVRESAELPWGERHGAVTVHFRGELWSFQSRRAIAAALPAMCGISSARVRRRLRGA